MLFLLPLMAALAPVPTPNIEVKEAVLGSYHVYKGEDSCGMATESPTGAFGLFLNHPTKTALVSLRSSQTLIPGETYAVEMVFSHKTVLIAAQAMSEHTLQIDNGGSVMIQVAESDSGVVFNLVASGMESPIITLAQSPELKSAVMGTFMCAATQGGADVEDEDDEPHGEGSVVSEK